MNESIKKMMIERTSREEFIRFAVRDYNSFRQTASRFVARLRGKHVYSRKEFIEKLFKFCDVVYPPEGK